MTFRFKYVFVACLIALASVAAYYFVNKKDTKWMQDATVDLTVYKPYVLNTKIVLSDPGNSADYINEKDGWGAQEPWHRNIVGDQAVINLYVKDGKDTPLRLKMFGFGVYDTQNFPYQEITVFANDKEITTWKVSKNDKYVAQIPSNVMQDNSLTIRLKVAHPYALNDGPRLLSMAIKYIEIDKMETNQMKIKISKWVKNKLKNIEVPEYEDSNNVKKEKSDH